jgi:hypothetical protein
MGALVLLAVACGGSKPAEVTVLTATSVPTVAPTVVATRPPATPTPLSSKACAPAQGRWIEVDVTTFYVRLMDGTKVVQEVAPVAVGREVDTGAYESTQTGCFSVYVKTAGLTYDAPYKTYIDWWVGFDPAKDNGFHSFLLDAKGNVVDGSTGRISNGCIRTGQAEAVFKFAEVGMPVWVHA